MFAAIIGLFAALYAYLHGRVLLREWWRFLLGEPKKALLARDWENAARLALLGSEDRDEKYESCVRTMHFWAPFSVMLWMICFLLSSLNMDAAANVVSHIASLGTVSIIAWMYIEVATHLSDKRWHSSVCSQSEQLESRRIMKHALICASVALGAFGLNFIAYAFLGTHSDDMPAILFLLRLFVSIKVMLATLDVVIRYEGRDCRCVN